MSTFWLDINAIRMGFGAELRDIKGLAVIFHMSYYMRVFVTFQPFIAPVELDRNVFLKI